MDAFFRGSKFAVVFEGDPPDAYFAEDWDAALEIVRQELGRHDAEWWRGVRDGCLNNPDHHEWQRNDFGPWRLRTEFGDGVFLTIYRLEEHETGRRGPGPDDVDEDGSYQQYKHRYGGTTPGGWMYEDQSDEDPS